MNLVPKECHCETFEVDGYIYVSTIYTLFLLHHCCHCYISFHILLILNRRWILAIPLSFAIRETVLFLIWNTKMLHIKFMQT